jgi:hypothetical protein
MRQAPERKGTPAVWIGREYLFVGYRGLLAILIHRRTAFKYGAPAETAAKQC